MAMVALYRPGPMAVIPEYIARKHDPSKITYPDPRLRDVLNTSYGLICFQDDVLLTSIALAGYTWEDADKLRKAVGKKIASEMKKQKEKFVNGCVQNGLAKKKAEDIFGLIEPFAGYGFNKAHAACYAMIAYQTAYLKANYTVEFMTAVLTAESRANTGDLRDDKISRIIDECRRMHITIMRPDVNSSITEFSIENKVVRFGLSAVKNVGAAAIEVILKAREEGGKFSSFTDFINRIDTSKVNKKTLESLVKTGAFDAFGLRSQLLATIQFQLDRSSKSKKDLAKGQGGLFDFETAESTRVQDDLPQIEELPHQDLLMFEKELLGFYLSSHPLSKVMNKLSNLNAVAIHTLSEELVGQRVTICGMVVSMKKIFTKANNQEMAFVRLEDTSGSIEIVVFPKLFARNPALWVANQIMLVSGKLDAKEEQLTILADDGKKIVFNEK
jgi:DNA polymerase-3 subunit alpha